MTLATEGYQVFEEAIPLWLKMLAMNEIRGREHWHFLWQASEENDLPRTFRYWLSGFLTDHGIRHHTVSDLVVFNRPVGNGMKWHDDSYGNPDGKGRAFVAVYLTSTKDGRGPLKIIPGSQDGAPTPFRERCRAARSALDDKSNPPSQEVLDSFSDVFGPHPDELALEVPAGSIVVADERIIHAAAPNNGECSRAMVLCWIHLIT